MNDPFGKIANEAESFIGWVFLHLLLVVIALGFVAPLFGPMIKKRLYRKYVFHKDYEAKAEKDMKTIRPLLWIACALWWTGLVIANLHYPFGF